MGLGARSPTEGAYVDLDELAALKHRAQGFNFLPRQPVHSLLSGRHASRMRGRGLDFEELREYLPGDDIRTIDWKVTARTRTPHVRVYTEERDRPALLVVDQRLSMFFGSVRDMKSVTAARLAAVAVWRVLDQGDRVGALVFNDREVHQVRPHRSQRTALQVLRHVVDLNRELRADSEATPDPGMLNRVLTTAERLARHDALVVVISDFDGVDEETTRLMTRLAPHNDVLAVPVYDPAATRPPPRRRLVVSDGELQFELSGQREQVRKRFADFSDNRLAEVLAWQKRLGVPVLPVCTDRDELEQLRELLGAGRPAAAGTGNRRT